MSDEEIESRRFFSSDDSRVQLTLEANFPTTDEDLEQTLRKLDPKWIPLFEATIPNDEYWERYQRVKAKIAGEGPA